MESAKHTLRQYDHLDKCCSICGDVGFEELILTCSKCQIVGQHLYCMASPHEEVPESPPKDWICEDCCYSPDREKCDGIGKENFQKTSNSIYYDAVRQGSPTKMSGYLGRRSHSIKTSKVKFLFVEQVMRLSSGAPNRVSPSKSNLGNRPGYSFVTPKFSPQKVKKNPSFLSFSPKKPPGLGGIPSISITSQKPQRTSKEQKAAINSTNEYNCVDTCRLWNEHSCKDTRSLATESCSKEQKISFIKPAKEFKTCNPDGPAKEVKNCNADVVAKEVKTCNMNSGSDTCLVIEPKKSDVEGRELSRNLPEHSLYHSFFPALHVVWKGGFKFLDTATPGKFYGGFQAQPPTRISCRAFEFAQRMPIVLQSELLPRNHVWTDLFQNDYPDFRDIALYFLPSENIERSKENHANLFELMEIQQSGLRSYINDVELLIFTSKQLDRDAQDAIQRSGLEQFLWGVFQHAKTNEFSEHDCPGTECSDTTDMEIDMVGGQPQVRVDTVVTRESFSRACVEPENVKKMAMKMSNDKIVSAFEDVDSIIQQLHLESEKAQQDLFSLFSEVSQKINGEMASFIWQSSVKENEPDIPPGFEKFSAQKFRNMSCEARFKVEAGVSDGRVIGHVQNDIDHLKVTKDLNPQSCTLEGKTEAEMFEYDHQDLKHKLSTRSPSETCKLACWSPPPKNWIKLNVAGSSKGNPGAAGAGGIIRDESGKWVIGYTLNLGTHTSLGAELWSIYMGLMRAWDKGFRRILVECTSPIVVHHLKKGSSEQDLYKPLVTCCMNVANRDWKCEVVHVDRDANLSANWLATHFEHHPMGMTVFDSPPDGLVPILQSDSMRIPCHPSP